MICRRAHVGPNDRRRAGFPEIHDIGPDLHGEPGQGGHGLDGGTQLLVSPLSLPAWHGGLGAVAGSEVSLPRAHRELSSSTRDTNAQGSEAAVVRGVRRLVGQQVVVIAVVADPPQAEGQVVVVEDREPSGLVRDALHAFSAAGIRERLDSKPHRELRRFRPSLARGGTIRDVPVGSRRRETADVDGVDDDAGARGRIRDAARVEVALIVGSRAEVEPVGQQHDGLATRECPEALDQVFEGRTHRKRVLRPFREDLAHALQGHSFGRPPVDAELVPELGHRQLERLVVRVVADAVVTPDAAVDPDAAVTPDLLGLSLADVRVRLAET